MTIIPLQTDRLAPLAGGSRLRRYFSSGWAFLVPYLFCYLLYYLLKWPPNPGSGRVIPSLLHLYWALHLIHAILGLGALRAWQQGPAHSASRAKPTTLHPSPSGFPPWISGLLPWVLLSLLFFIPGAYLEFPSDPWVHYARINEWSDLAAIGSHSTWFKSSYFLAYSLLGRLPPDRQFFWLDVYYAGACLLLCWQYYRLARAVGLGESGSLLFVVLQAVLFGNSSFSFYRYYGLSSTMFSQLGAIGLIRLGLEIAGGESQAANPPPSPPPRGRWFSRLHPAISAFCLLSLIAFNHVQGLGIAALGLAAVAIWRLLRWKCSLIWWLSAAVVVLSIIVLHWWPHHLSLERLCRAQGWFTVWGGFNIISPQSPAGDRALQILGWLGVINLAAGLLLLCRNHVIGWLTVMPVLALCLPVVAIPLASVLTRRVLEDIIAFHRLLLAIPAGLALACLWNDFLRRFFPPFLLLLVVLLTLTTLPASGPFYNRAWHALMRSPEDLTMRTVCTDFYRGASPLLDHENATFAATAGSTFVLSAQKPHSLNYILADHRLYYSDCRAPVTDLETLRNILTVHKPTDRLVVMTPRPVIYFTPYSFAALCSRHWSPQEAVLASSGTKELGALSLSAGLHRANQSGAAIFYTTASR